MNSDRLFKGMLIAVGAIVIASIVTIIAVSNFTGSGSTTSSGETAYDHIAGITKKYPFNSTKSALASDNVWNKSMTMGDTSNPNKIIVYSDLFCPYCAKEARAAHDDGFKSEFLDSKKVFYELRMTDTLAMGNDRPSANSTRGGEALYCAANQNKFWEYFYRMLEKIQTDYYDKGLGGYHGAPEIPIIDDSFFYDGAKDVGIDVAKLTSCVSDGTGLKSLRQATDSALKWNRDANGKAQGLPAIFVNNKFITAGFGEGGYPDFRKTLVAAGIK